MSIRDRALGNGELPKLEEQTVAVPEWGGDVKVVALDGLRLREFFDAPKGKSNELRHAALVAVSAFDVESGERLFTVTDLDRLDARPAGMMRVWGVAHDLNPWLFPVGGAEKNAGRSGGSVSASA